MKQCSICSKVLSQRNRSGMCAACRMRALNSDAAVNVRRGATRVAGIASRSPEQRLEKYRVRRGDGECWGWTGCDNGVGYPKLTVNKEQRLATHIALEADGRRRPSDQHVACHSCDNPPCTNPAHLWWGTEKENMQDASQKGRMQGWSRRPGAKREVAA